MCTILSKSFHLWLQLKSQYIARFKHDVMVLLILGFDVRTVIYLDLIWPGHNKLNFSDD